MAKAGAKLTGMACLLGLVVLARPVGAQDLALPSCASNPPKPSRVVTVPGFSNERLYLHPRHPAYCTDAGDDQCKASAYVIAGDQLTVSDSCADWSFAQFNGKSKVSGWVASRRLPDANRVAPLPAAPEFAESVAQSAHPVCREAESRLNESLRKGGVGDLSAALPSALVDSETLSAPPAGVAAAEVGNQVWSVVKSTASIQGQSLAAVTYSAGGTCHDDYLELWTPDFSQQVTPPGANADGGASGYSADELVKLANQVYFAHITRSARSVALTGFGKSLAAAPMCSLNEMPLHHELRRQCSLMGKFEDSRAPMAACHLSATALEQSDWRLGVESRR